MVKGNMNVNSNKNSEKKTTAWAPKIINYLYIILHINNKFHTTAS